jgi:hypothetical protein
MSVCGEIENLEADVRFHQEKIREAKYKIHKLKMSEPKEESRDIWYDGDGGELYE